MSHHTCLCYITKETDHDKNIPLLDLMQGLYLFGTDQKHKQDQEHHKVHDKRFWNFYYIKMIKKI